MSTGGLNQHDVPPCTLWIRRIEHRELNIGCKGLRQFGQPIAPSILFPVFHPPYPQGSGEPRKITKSLTSPSKLADTAADHSEIIS